jgi:PPK2 family polyphosphate:nucleotide phosphotransferase
MEAVLDEFIFPPDSSKRLSDYNTSLDIDIKHKPEAKTRLEAGIKELRGLQDKLYAMNRYSMLIVFQALDAAGKDGTIKHVMSGVNPQGCQVSSFKTPSDEELDHTYLWRCIKALPRRGNIGIFNRSYYEELLVVKVHPELIKRQRLPKPLSDPKDAKFWIRRYADVNGLEKYLINNGMQVLKFFLHVSKEEQKNRFLSRINDPNKHWKISLSDFKERQHWDKYQKAYEDMLLNTSTTHAPWYVIPADQKWFMRALIMEIIVNKLKKLDLRYPEVTEKKKVEIEQAKTFLESEE